MFDEDERNQIRAEVQRATAKYLGYPLDANPRVNQARFHNLKLAIVETLNSLAPISGITVTEADVGLDFSSNYGTVHVILSERVRRIFYDS